MDCGHCNKYCQSRFLKELTFIDDDWDNGLEYKSSFSKSHCLSVKLCTLYLSNVLSKKMPPTTPVMPAAAVANVLECIMLELPVKDDIC